MKKKVSFNGEEFEYDLQRYDGEVRLTQKNISTNARFIKKISDGRFLVEIDGQAKNVFFDGENILIDGIIGNILSGQQRRSGNKSSGNSDMNSPMPGKILKVLVSKGDSVKAGQGIIVMEAMKMEHTIKAVFAGTIEDILFEEGQLVDGGIELFKIEENK